VSGLNVQPPAPARTAVTVRHVLPVVGLTVAVAWFDVVGLALPYFAPDLFAVTADDVFSGRLGPLDLVWQGAGALYALAARVLLLLAVLPLAAGAALWCARCAVLAARQGSRRVALVAAGSVAVCAALALAVLAPLGGTS
jgi:hypothetical protein